MNTNTKNDFKWGEDMKGNENFKQLESEDELKLRLEQVISTYQIDYIDRGELRSQGLRGQVLRSRRHLKRYLHDMEK